MTKTIGFLGGGNMASALIGGIINNELYQPENIYTSVATKKSVDRLTKQFGIKASLDSHQVIKSSDIVVIAVKPYMVNELLTELKNDFRPGQVIVSIASGITLDQLKALLPEQKIYRAMPNTPAAVGKGMTSLTTTLSESESSRESVTELFKAVGEVAWISEKLMHAAIAVHGSSPAYVFMMIEAMADGAVLEGMPRDKAYLMAAQSLIGAATMVLESGLHPGALKDQVTSPGGNTIAAISVLEATGFRSSIISAIHAAAEKSREMEAGKL